MSEASPENVRASDLVETPPEPSAHVVNKPASESPPVVTPAAPPQPASSPAMPSGPVLPPKTDRRGVPFDAEKHIDKMHPVSGNWMPKKPKRPPVVSSLGRAQAPATPRSFVAPDSNGAPEAEAPAPEVGEVPGNTFQVAALGACTTFYAVGMTLGGDEWRPSDDEHENLMRSFEAYFRAKGITELSPGWALAIAAIAYAGPRFRQPKTLSSLQRIGAFFQRIAAWWKARSVSNSIPTA